MKFQIEAIINRKKIQQEKNGRKMEKQMPITFNKNYLDSLNK